MAQLSVDNSALSLAAQLLVKISGKDVKIASNASGEVPSLSVDGQTHNGLQAVANALVPGHSVLGASDTKEVEKWLSFLSKELLPSLAAKDNKLVGKYHKVNKDLSGSVFAVGNHLTIVDLAFYAALHPVVKDWKDEDRNTFNHITRWFDFVQHQDELESNGVLPLLQINKNLKPVAASSSANATSASSSSAQPATSSAQPATSSAQPSAEKSSKKEAAAPGKKPEGGERPQASKKPETKEEREAALKAKEERKLKNQQARGGAAAPAAEAKKELPMDVSRLDIRVGKIVDVKKHESADSLYVEQIDLGEGAPRQVVSGLVKFVPIEEMQGREVVVLCNLKASNLRGVKSQAMVLAASNADHTHVELLTPPSGSKIGERVTFEGFEGEADKELNPKQKVFETVSPDLKTNDDCVATYKGVAFRTSAGIVTVKSIKNGGIK